MKKYTKSLLFCIAMLVIASCSKSPSDLNVRQPVHVPIEKISRVLATSDVHDLSSVYAAMTPAERKAVWLAHIDSLISSNQYTPMQMNQVLELKSMLNSFSFEGSNSDFIVNELQDWLSVASTILSEEQIYLLCFTLCDNMVEEMDRLDMLPSGGNPPQRPDCNCKIKNLFACMAHPANCRTISCSSKSGIGCGWLMIQECTGKCRLIVY